MLLMSASGWRVKVAKARTFEVMLKSPRMFNSLPFTGGLSRYCALKPPLFVGSMDCKPGAPANSFIRICPFLSIKVGSVILLPETAGNAGHVVPLLFTQVLWAATAASNAAGT
jgi:hypothetical protein